jgi:hypothetical protein
MQGEYAANRARTVELGQEAERRGRDSVGMILAGGLVTGLMFADSGSTQRQEGEALERRNQRLREMAAQRECAI